MEGCGAGRQVRDIVRIGCGAVMMELIDSRVSFWVWSLGVRSVILMESRLHGDF